MAEDEALFLELSLQRRAARSGAESGDLTFLVQRQQAIHALQRQRQHGASDGGTLTCPATDVPPP